MTVNESSAQMSAAGETSESDMWAAELLLIPDGNTRVRSAQFAIRTAVRAQALAERAGTDPIDELLDARISATSDTARRVYEIAIAYLRADQVLGRRSRSRG